MPAKNVFFSAASYKKDIIFGRSYLVRALEICKLLAHLKLQELRLVLHGPKHSFGRVYVDLVCLNLLRFFCSLC